MKKALPILAITALVLSLGTQHANAGNDKKALYALGGFIGGVITANAFNKDKPRHHTTTVVTHQRAPVHCETIVRHSPPRGYYENVRVKVWVPARTHYTYDRCGTRVRHYQAGYYRYETERVWVSTSRGHTSSHRSYARR